MADPSPPGSGRLCAGEPAATRRSPPVVGAASWKPWTVAPAFVAAVALALAGRATVTDNGADPLAAGALILLTVAPVALALLLANLHDPPTAGDFGLRRPTLRRAIALAVAVWFVLTALTILWVATLGLDDTEGQALTERLGTDGTLTVLVLIIVLTILAPLGEEVLFRGYVFRALRNRLVLWPAAITTGSLFAAAHIGWVPLELIAPIVVFGIGLCLLYHWTASLYPGIAVHAFGNAIPLGDALDWTWQTPMLIAGSTFAALTLARLIALALGDRRSRSGDEQLLVDSAPRRSRRMGR